MVTASAARRAMSLSSDLRNRTQVLHIHPSTLGALLRNPEQTGRLRSRLDACGYFKIRKSPFTRALNNNTTPRITGIRSRFICHQLSRYRSGPHVVAELPQQIEEIGTSVSLALRVNSDANVLQFSTSGSGITPVSTATRISSGQASQALM